MVSLPFLFCSRLLGSNTQLNIYMRTLFLLISILSVSNVWGQDSMDYIQPVIDFEDGFYLSFEDFKQNKPSHSLKELKPFVYRHDADANGLFFDQTTLDAFPTTSFKEMDALWGICIEGMPYIKVETDSSAYFTKLYVVGNISYYYYRTFVPKTILMNVYNPFTGKIMGTKPVVNHERIQMEKMFKLNDGVVMDFNYENLKEAVSDDSELLTTLTQLPESEREEKIFKILLIYNDRNPVDFK